MKITLKRKAEDAVINFLVRVLGIDQSEGKVCG